MRPPTSGADTWLTPASPPSAKPLHSSFASAPALFTANGIAYTRLRIATNDRSKPEFHECITWRQTAEFADKYLTKGRVVYTEGWLHTRTWQADNGTTRKSVEVVIEILRALTPRQTEATREGAGEGEGEA